MRKRRYQRRQSRSAVWAARLGILAFLVMCTAGLAHRFAKLTTPWLAVFAACAAVLALLAIISAAAGFRNLWTNGDKGGGRSFWGMALAIVVLTPVLGFAGQWYLAPANFDLSTDLDNQLAFPSGMPERLPGMNVLDNQMRLDPVAQISLYPDVIGRRFDAAPDRVILAARNVFRSFRWPVVARGNSGDGPVAQRLAATAHDFYLGFKSDIVVQALDEGESTFVDVRALLQYGSKDMGLNARFISQFFTALDAEVNKAPADVKE